MLPSVLFKKSSHFDLILISFYFLIVFPLLVSQTFFKFGQRINHQNNHENNNDEMISENEINQEEEGDVQN